MKRILSILILLIAAIPALAQDSLQTARRVFVSVNNEGVTGTTRSRLAKLTGAPSTAKIAATTDTDGVLGVVVGGAGTSGAAAIQSEGRVYCDFDGATTAGDYVQISSSTAGKCHDSGAGTYPSSGQVLGRVLSTNVGAGNYEMILFAQAKGFGAGFTGSTGATDNAVLRADGTGGSALQNSLATIDDSGSINIPSGQTYKINTVALAKGDVGLGNVDNTSDATKNAAAAALTNKTSVGSAFFFSAAADPADAGAIRLGNNEFVEWEKATPGTDWTLGVNASDVLVSSAPFAIGAGSAITSSGAGGALGALSFITPGTGVATAGAVNIGSAGAFVVNGGALGSPSSAGTMPGFTLGGTIAGGGNQLNNIIIGASTPLAGSFTTLGASGIITSTVATSGIMLATGTSTAAKNIHLGTTGGDFYFGIQDNPATFFGQALANESVLYSFTQPLTIVHGANTAAATTKFSATNVTHGGTLTVSGITTDSGHTDSTVCQDTTSHQFYFGSGTAGVCLGTSSLRFKRDIASLDLGLAEINALKPVSFVYLNGYGDNGARRQVGFLAEDMFKTIPSLVGLDKDGRPQSVDYMGIVPILVNAVKEMQKEIDLLKKEKQ